MSVSAGFSPESAVKSLQFTNSDSLLSMDVLSAFRIVWPMAVCAALVACASAGPDPAGVVRGRAPQGYEKTINSYFAFKVRNPRKNVEIGVDKPEPSDCPLDGYITSTRGWVVPVVYATRTGAMTGKETINITGKQYYFWFSGDTLAGVTTRLELCPGAMAVSEVAEALAVAEDSPTPRSPLPAARQAQSQAGPSTTGQVTRDDVKGEQRAASLQPRDKMLEAKKTRPSPGTLRKAIKKSAPRK